MNTACTDFDESQIQLTIYSNSLYTGIDDRDNHLRSSDFLDTKNFPTIKFVSTSVHVNDSDIKVKGILTIKGIEQELEFDAKFVGVVRDPVGNIKAGFEVDTLFDRKDFNITWNQYIDQQGILIGDQVKIHADVHLLKLNN